jgi:retron-type reverse transcriptase
LKRHFNLFETVASLPNLHRAAVEAMQGKRGTVAAAGFFAEMEEELPRLHDELTTGEYRHGSYTYFAIHEPKERLVAAAGFRDRVVHHALVRVIEPLFERRFIEDSFACRTGKGTHAGKRRAAEFARRFDWALKCDVRQYFPHVDHGVLLELLRRVIGDRRVLELCENILASHRDGVRYEVPPGGDLFALRRIARGLPIGNLTSQFWANVYLNPLDQFVKHELRCQGYVRYMDDFVLFHHDRQCLRDWGAALKERLGALRLEMHPDKYGMGPTRRGVDFCGFVVFADGRIRVRTATVRRFHRRYRARLAAVNRHELDIRVVMDSVRAWIGHVRHAQSWNLRRAVLCGASTRGRTGPGADVARAARRVVRQQRQQPARRQPQQQRPGEREQQHRFSCRLKPLAGTVETVPVAARTAAVTQPPPRQCRGSGTTRASRGPAAGGRGGE